MRCRKKSSPGPVRSACFWPCCLFSSAAFTPWALKVGAKTYPTLNVFNVKDYQAVNDGKTICTKQIQNAIDAWLPTLTAGTTTLPCTTQSIELAAGTSYTLSLANSDATDTLAKSINSNTTWSSFRILKLMVGLALVQARTSSFALARF